MPFLTFYTPTYRRPKLLADCVASVQRQSDSDWQHLIIPDEVGIGIGGMFAAVKLNVGQIHGKYVYFLQDDDIIVDQDFVAGLKEFTKDNNYPPVVIVRNIKGPLNLPDIWQARPERGHIDLGSYVTRMDIFAMHADKFLPTYDGDFEFIRALWDLGYEFAWWDRLVARAQQWGFGRPEYEVVNAQA